MFGNKQKLRMFALLALGVLAVGMSAFAATPGSTLRVMLLGETHTGLCCSVWGDAVEIVQPEKPVPMIVTWSGDYRANTSIEVGLRLNDGPCTFYGPAFLHAAQPTDYGYASATMQWVILPGDYGLRKATNTVQLCGGGVDESSSVELGFYTITVRLDK